MSDKLDEDIRLWASQVMHSVLESTGYSHINAVERIIRDPGIAYNKQEHKVLWWPWGQRVAKIHKAAHRLTTMEKICLMVQSGVVHNDDKTPMDKHMFCKQLSLSLREFDINCRFGKKRIKHFLNNFNWLLA